MNIILKKRLYLDSILKDDKEGNLWDTDTVDVVIYSEDADVEADLEAAV